MAGSIGKAALQLSTNDKQLNKGLAQAGQKVKQQTSLWVANISKGVSFAGTGITGAVVASLAAVRSTFSEDNNPFSKLEAAAMSFGQSLGSSLGPVADSLGTGLATAAELAKPAIESIGTILAGLAEVVSPVIEVIGAGLGMIGEFLKPVFSIMGEWAAQWGGVREIVLDVLQAIATGIAYTIDIIRLVANIINQYLIAPITIGFGFVTQGLGYVLKALSFLPFVGSSLKQAGDSVVKFGKNTVTAGQELWTSAGKQVSQGIGQSTKAVDAMFDNIRNSHKKTKEQLENPIGVKLKADVGEFQKKLLEAVAATKLNQDELEIFKFRQRGATDSLLKGVTALSKFKTNMEEGKQVTEANLDPLEIFQREQEKLDRLVSFGAISFDTYSRGIAKANQALADQQKLHDIKTPQIAQQNSREAVEAIIRSRLRTDIDATGKDEKARRERAAELLAATAVDQKKLLQDISSQGNNVVQFLRALNIQGF